MGLPPPGGGGMGLPLALRGGAAGGEGGAGGAAGRPARSKPPQPQASRRGAARGAVWVPATGSRGGIGTGRGGNGAGSGMPPVERTTRCWGGGGGASSGSVVALAATGSGAAAGSGAGSAGGSSTTGSRFMPLESARRRTRSAEASSMLDEWLLTPILSSAPRSRTWAFSIPSSRASS